MTAILSLSEIEWTAKRMLEMHGDKTYEPHDRAIDHAFGYDRYTFQHQYWRAVARAIRRIEQNITAN